MSEILLQQTQVERVIPYFLRILERFPTLASLAEADYDTFFPYYQGMGYYSRARNILKTAQKVTHEYGGIFPGEKSLLATLPWVWEYTSRAILAFGYGEPYLAWDTNLEKVFARYQNGTKDQKLTEQEKDLIEKDFQDFVEKNSGKELTIEKQVGESEGDKLSESDESKKQMSEANEFLSPSGPFGTFQSWKVQSTSLVRAINNALMDFASTIDLKNPENIDWENYPITSGKFFESRGTLEEKEIKVSASFPTPDASVIVILHENHQIYYSDIPNTYTPYILPPAWERDTRQYVQDCFRTKYALELSVRPAHKKWLSEDGKPYIAVNAQVQVGDISGLQKFTKKEANIYLKSL